jgi:hypothetical protein
MSFKNFRHQLVKDMEPRDIADPNGPDEELHKWARAIKEMLPIVEFGSNPSYRKGTWVYVPNETYARGCITYADMRKSHGENQPPIKRTYNLYTPRIVNGKVNTSDMSAYRISTTSFDRAKREAAKHLAEYATAEIVMASIDEMGSAEDAYQGKLGRKLQTASNEMFGTNKGNVPDALLRELRLIGVDGVQDPELRGKFTSFVDLDDEYTSYKADYGSMRACLVEAREGIHGHPIFYTCDIGEVSKVQSALYWADTPSGMQATASLVAGTNLYHTETDLADALGDDVMNRLAALNMCEPFNLMPRVGMKVTDRVFYVYR